MRSPNYLWTKVTLLLFLCPLFVVTASAQSLSDPLVSLPSVSLVPDQSTLEVLPPAASNLLAPTSGNEMPPDALGANLQNTTSNPFIYAAPVDRPAAGIDTTVRGTQQIDAGAQGSLSSRSLFGAAQVARWTGAGPTPSMKPMQSSDLIAGTSAFSWILPAVGNSGTPGSSATANPGSLNASGRGALASAAAHKQRNGGHYSSSATTGDSVIFGFMPGTPETHADFGQSPFESIGNQQFSFLQLNSTMVGYSGRGRGRQRANPLPATEMERLRSQLHPPTYSRGSTRKRTHPRATMKSLLDGEGQSPSSAPVLPPIFFLPE